MAKLKFYDAASQSWVEVKVSDAAVQVNSNFSGETLNAVLADIWNQVETVRNTKEVKDSVASTDANHVWSIKKISETFATKAELASALEAVAESIEVVDAKVDALDGKVTGEVARLEEEIEAAKEADKWATQVLVTEGTDTPLINSVGALKAGYVLAGKSVEQILKDMLLPYLKPTVSLSASAGQAVREKGTSYTLTTLTANVGKKSDKIAAVRFYQGSNELTPQVSVNENGGNHVYTFGTAVTIKDSVARNQFKVEVEDTNGSSSKVSAALSNDTWVDPYFYGLSSELVITDEIAKAGKKDVTAKGSKTYSYGAQNNQAMFIAYPASHGNINSAVMDGATPIASILDKGSFTHTRPDGTTVEYTYYRTGLLTDANTHKIVFGH